MRLQIQFKFPLHAGTKPVIIRPGMHCEHRRFSGIFWFREVYSLKLASLWPDNDDARRNIWWAKGEADFLITDITNDERCSNRFIGRERWPREAQGCLGAESHGSPITLWIQFGRSRILGLHRLF